MIISLLDNIRSAYNVGSIFRTSDGLGIDKLYLCGYTGAPMGKNLSRIHKTALGAEEVVEWEYAKDILETIDKLKEQGFLIVAIEKTSNSQNLLQLKAKMGESGKKIALIFGNEVYGVSEPVLAKSDLVAHLPMEGEKQSYNVSIAFALAVSVLKFKA